MRAWRRKNAERLSANSRVYRVENKERIIANDRAARTRKIEFMRAIKDGPCIDCGVEYPPYVMDFDHVRGEKKFAIGAAGRYSQKRVLAEIAKCDLVCSNCHRERTHQRGQA
jgi:hypothetical protein